MSENVRKKMTTATTIRWINCHREDEGSPRERVEKTVRWIADNLNVEQYMTVKMLLDEEGAVHTVYLE